MHSYDGQPPSAVKLYGVFTPADADMDATDKGSWSIYPTLAEAVELQERDFPGGVPVYELTGSRRGIYARKTEVVSLPEAARPEPVKCNPEYPPRVRPRKR